MPHESFDIVWHTWCFYNQTFFLRVIDSSKNDVAQFQNWKRKTDYDLNLLCVSFSVPIPSGSDMYFLLCFLIPVPYGKISSVIYIYNIYICICIYIYINIYNSNLTFSYKGLQSWYHHSFGAEIARDISIYIYLWLSPLRVWGTLTMAFTGKFVCVCIYIYIFGNEIKLRFQVLRVSCEH